MTRGEKLRDRGLSQVEEKGREFVARMREEAKRISAQFGEVTSDDLRARAAELKLEAHHPNVWGSIFVAAGWIMVGRRKSQTASARAREIRVWRWAGTDAPAIPVPRKGALNSCDDPPRRSGKRGSAQLDLLGGGRG